jgi:hypothetical protein
LITATLPFNFDGKTLQWEFPTLNANQSQMVEFSVQVPITMTGQIKNADYGAISDEAIAPILTNGESNIPPIPIQPQFILDLPLIFRP